MALEESTINNIKAKALNFKKNKKWKIIHKICYMDL